MTAPSAPLSLDPQACRTRQRRLAAVLARRALDCAVLVRPEHVQYFTAYRPHRYLSAAVVLEAEGRAVLVAAEGEAPLCEDPAGRGAIDDAVPFAAQLTATLRQDQSRGRAEALGRALATLKRPARVGVEFSSLDAWGREALAACELIDLDAELWRLRRRKDPDELALIARAIACTEAMYARAREILAPGISELEVYGQLHAAAVEAAGEPLTDLGNDFQANSPGGPPRPRAVEEGELYILDLGAAYRGYYADNCRTFYVGRGDPSPSQREAWQRVVDVLTMVERTARTGMSCRELYEAARDMLDAYRPGAFFHHLGHGIGLDPHETPHLNPNWDDRLAEGDVLTAEPGLYGPELRGGIRLEEIYRVTADGLQRLTRFPLDL